MFVQSNSSPRRQQFVDILLVIATRMFPYSSGRGAETLRKLRIHFFCLVRQLACWRDASRLLCICLLVHSIPYMFIHISLYTFQQKCISIALQAFGGENGEPIWGFLSLSVTDTYHQGADVQFARLKNDCLRSWRNSPQFDIVVQRAQAMMTGEHEFARVAWQLTVLPHSGPLPGEEWRWDACAQFFC